MINTSQKLREFEGLLRCSQFLVKYGFHFEGSEIARSKGVSDRLILVFSSPDRNRTLQYTFSLGSEKSGPYVMVDVINQDGDELSLEDYVQHGDLLEAGRPDPFLLNSYQGNFIEQSRQIINYVDNVLSTHLLNIVIGYDWVKVPFDWKGYK